MTRLKKDLQWKVRENRPVPQNSSILRDQIIEIRPYRRNYTLTLRIVTKWDVDNQEEIKFLSNHLELGARP